MTFDINISNIFSIIKYVHSAVSVAFMINAIWVFINSTKGVLYNKVFTKIDKVLSYGFIIGLYLQLIFGIILSTNLGYASGYEYISPDGTIKMVSKRLWPVEHIVLMLFSLFIANLGLILALKTEKDKEKHKRILVYYSVSLILILFSLGAIYIF